MSYAVKEMFLTLQGEGVNAGRRAVFVRFAGCNLWSGREADRATAICQFCDTDFVGTDGAGGGRFADAEALADAVVGHWGSGGADRRDNTTLPWRFPYGFLDQGFSSPVRMPTPAGDYCYVFDVENREPADTRLLRNLDSQYCLQSLPHPLDTLTTPVGGPP